jgi:hypothetical protein
MFLKNNSDVIPLRYPIQSTGIAFTSGGVLYSSGGYTGRQFTSSGSLVVSVGGSFTALIVDVGQTGGSGGTVRSGGSYNSTVIGYYQGSGGSGGYTRIVTGTLNAGTYTVTLPTYPYESPTIPYTSLLSTTVYTSGAGGSGFVDSVSGTDTAGTNGGSGPSLPIPFNNISVSGGGGGGGPADRYGGPAVGGIGGIYSYSTTLFNAISTSYGGGGGGGNNSNNIGGLGGPALYIIVGDIDGVTSNISDTTRINTMLINNTYTLSNFLDNYYSVYFNPNTTLFAVPIIPNISTYANSYTIGGVSITTALGYPKLPFNVTSSTASTYFCNKYRGYYNVVLTTDGTYTITFSSAITNLVAYVCSRGGDGGSGDYSGGGGDGGGGGSGTVTRGTISLPIGAVLTCALNTSNFYRVTYAATGSYISVTNGSNGGNSPGSANGAQGANGVASSAGSSFTSISSSSGAAIATNFGTTPGGYVMHTNASSAIGFGGAGSTGGNGGKYGSSGVAPTRDGVGYGAGGGGEVSFEGGAGSGAPGVIILSIPFA